MKKFWVGSTIAIVLALSAPLLAGDMLGKPPWHPPVRPDPVSKLVKVKRKIAVELCVAMARSGAYTELDDNEFSDFCIKVASHLGDSEYDHTDEE